MSRRSAKRIHDCERLIAELGLGPLTIVGHLRRGILVLWPTAAKFVMVVTKQEASKCEELSPRQA